MTPATVMEPCKKLYLSHQVAKDIDLRHNMRRHGVKLSSNQIGRGISNMWDSRDDTMDYDSDSESESESESEDDESDEEGGDGVAESMPRAHAGASEGASPMKVAQLKHRTNEMRAKVIELNRLGRIYGALKMGVWDSKRAKADAAAAAGAGTRKVNSGAGDEEGADGFETAEEDGEDEEEEVIEEEGATWDTIPEGRHQTRDREVIYQMKIVGASGRLFKNAAIRKFVALGEELPIPEGHTRRPPATPEGLAARAKEAVAFAKAHPGEVSKSRALRKTKT